MICIILNNRFTKREAYITLPRENANKCPVFAWHKLRLAVKKAKITPFCRLLHRGRRERLQAERLAGLLQGGRRQRQIAVVIDQALPCGRQHAVEERGGQRFERLIGALLI